MPYTYIIVFRKFTKIEIIKANNVYQVVHKCISKFGLLKNNIKYSYKKILFSFDLLRKKVILRIVNQKIFFCNNIHNNKFLVRN